MKELLTKGLVKIIGADNPDLELILSAFHPRSFARKEIFSKPGETSKHVYFVNKGCMRAYYIQPDGEECTRYIAFEGDFFSSLASFITRQPSLEFAQALEPSEVMAIHRDSFDMLLKGSIAFEKIYLRSLESAYLINTWRLESFITRDAKERYEFLLQKKPEIVQRLANKIVASYLGISQETLSRLKSKR